MTLVCFHLKVAALTPYSGNQSNHVDDHRYITSRHGTDQVTCLLDQAYRHAITNHFLHLRKRDIDSENHLLAQYEWYRQIAPQFGLFQA